MTASDVPPWAEWLEGFLAELDRDEPVAEFVAFVDAGIMAQLPEIAGDPVLVDDLHTSTRSQWRAFLTSATGPDYRFELPAQAADLARSLARRGLDLRVLLKVYRTAHQMVFQYFSDATAEVAGGAPARDEVLIYIWQRAGQWMDDSIERLIEIYYDERQLRLEGALARRTEIVEGLLAGTVTGADDASMVLGHALGHWQTALVAWAPEAGVGVGDAMSEIADAAARSLGAPHPLSLLVGTRDLWAWIATPAAPDLAPLAQLHDRLDAAGIRIAVGGPAPGVAGFRTSHEEARAAHQLAAGAPATAPIVDYRDVELLTLAAGREQLLRRMVARELGDLLGADKNLAQLRDTVLAYLTTRNVEAAAERLFVHKNTVRYRVARAEELLGHPITERAAHLELALRYVALFGPPGSTD